MLKQLFTHDPWKIAKGLFFYDTISTVRISNEKEEDMTLELGKLEEASKYFNNLLRDCTMCARNCHVNREKHKGFCGQAISAKITNAVLHFGEEPPLVGNGGAGAVFFVGCGMRCVYCQNFAFSQLNHGHEMSFKELGNIFLKLQESGATTLDLVTPEPHLHSILEALLYAKERGLSVPIVFNTSSYVNTETLKQLDGIVDIYLADIRYTNDEFAMKYSRVPNYWKKSKRALREMYRQVGAFNEERMLGLIVRHLLLPNNLSGTQKAMRFIAEELSTSVPISLMSQYFPVYKARNISELNRRISKEEYSNALKIVERYGLRGWFQPLGEKENGVYAKAI